MAAVAVARTRAGALATVAGTGADTRSQRPPSGTSIRATRRGPAKAASVVASKRGILTEGRRIRRAWVELLRKVPRGPVILEARGQGRRTALPLSPPAVSREVLRPEVIRLASVRTARAGFVAREVIRPASVRTARAAFVAREVIRSEIIRPEVIRPEVIRSEIIRSEIIRPEVIRPEIIRPEIIRAASARPARAAPTRPARATIGARAAVVAVLEHEPVPRRRPRRRQEQREGSRPGGSCRPPPPPHPHPAPPARALCRALAPRGRQ